MKSLFSFLQVCLLSAVIATPLYAAPKPAMPLWPEGVPGEKDLELPPESQEDKANDGIWRVSNVSEPTLTFYPAPADKNTGATVVVCPGGGYSILAISHEGTQVCEWLNSIGVNAALLKYRVPRRDGLEKHHAPLQDAQRAMSLIRKNAGGWKIDPDRIGVLGFSAGGHLAAMALTNGATPRTYPEKPDIDKFSCQPNFAILVYPAYLQDEAKPEQLSPEIKIDKNTPPVFMVIAHDDKRFVQGNALLYLELARAEVPAELHIFAKGGHGFGMKHTGQEVQQWPDIAGKWMDVLGFLKSAK